MRAAHHPIRSLIAWFAILTLLTLSLASCGGGNGDEANGGPQSGGGDGAPQSGGFAPRGEETATARPETDAPEPAGQDEEGDEVQMEIPAGIGDLTPEDILRVIPRATENLLTIDVQAAINAVRDHEDVRDDLKDEWDDWGFSEEFSIDITDLDHIAFGEVLGPDHDVFLFFGLDLDDLRDTLDDLEYREDEVMGEEVWFGDISWVFFDEAVMAGSRYRYRLTPILWRLAGHYDILAEMLPEFATTARTGAVDEDLLRRLSQRPELLATMLWHFEVEVPDEVEDAFEEATGEDYDNYSPEIEEVQAISEWLADREEELSTTFLHHWTGEYGALLKSAVYNTTGHEPWSEEAAVATALQLLQDRGEPGDYEEEELLELAAALQALAVEEREQEPSELVAFLQDLAEEEESGDYLDTDDLTDHRPLLSSEAGDLWMSLPEGIVKQMIVFMVSP